MPSPASASTKTPPVLLAGAVVVLLLEVLLSLAIGPYPVPIPVVARIVLRLLLPWPLPAHPDWTATELVVVQAIRLPRVLVATIAGAGLGLAGAALQGLFRNPLVGPDIIGVSGGSACGGVLAILLGLDEGATVGLALAGGLVATLLAAGLARLIGGGALTVVLAGIVVGAFFTALLTLAEVLADPDTSLPAIVYWLLGSFADADRNAVLTIGLPTLAAGALLLGLRWRINLLSLGDAEAMALGVHPARLRWAILALVGVLVAAQVAVSGVIGWVGLIIPHLARFLVGADHRRLLPAATLIGAGFLLGVDDLARALPGRDLPIGLLTALLGTPSFAAILWRARKGAWRGD